MRTQNLTKQKAKGTQTVEVVYGFEPTAMCAFRAISPNITNITGMSSISFEGAKQDLIEKIKLATNEVEIPQSEMIEI